MNSIWPNQNNVVLDTIYLLDKSVKGHEVIDYILDTFNDILVSGDMMECNRLLKSLDVNYLSKRAIAAILTITACVKMHLSARSEFYSRAYNILVMKYGVRDTEFLLVGLK